MEEHREHYVKCGGEKFLDLMDHAEASVLRSEVARLRCAADERDAAIARAEKAEAECARLRRMVEAAVDFCEREIDDDYRAHENVGFARGVIRVITEAGKGESA